MKKSYYYIVFSCFLVFCFPLAAWQEDNYLPDYLLSYPETAFSAAKEPFSWNQDNWLIVGSLFLAVGGIYCVDEDLREIYQKNRNEVADAIFKGAKQVGEVKIMFPAMALTALAGYIAKDEKTVDTGMLCLKSSFLALSVTQILQLTAQRQKPYKEEGKQFWNGNGISFFRDSFPSGHSTLVWSLAPVLAEQYQETKFITPMAYSIAVLTSLSRLNDDQHWTSDVLTGAVIGYVTGKYILKNTPHFYLSPQKDLPGVTIFFEF